MKGLLAGLVAVGTVVVLAPAAPAAVAAVAAPAAAEAGWVGDWATVPDPTGTSGTAGHGVTDRTLRQVVHLARGGAQLRVRLSNRFGSQPLTVDEAALAPQVAGAAVDGAQARRLSFSGSARVVIPVGTDVESDPVDLDVPAGSDLAISLYFGTATGPLTWHPRAQATSYSAAGDHAGDVDGAAFTSTSTSWYVLDRVDVRAPSPHGAVVAFGDSITDGAVSTTDANHRYPDDLARRLGAAEGKRAPSVLNEGTSGNRLLTDADTAGLRAGARFERDVLDQPGARSVIILEGVNDIGTNLGPTPGSPATAQDVIDALQQLADRAHARGLRVNGATLTPFAGSVYDTPDAQQKRIEINNWIRTTTAFDAVADFDAAVRDPSDPSRYQPTFDGGDHLHPNDAGYAAMAQAVDLNSL